jgi:hypothetical protein
MRRVFHDAMLSAGALLLLVALLAAFDSRVRDHVMLRSGPRHATAEMAEAGGELHGVVNVVVDVVNNAVHLHTTLTIFVVVATVLTVFMVRT